MPKERKTELDIDDIDESVPSEDILSPPEKEERRYGLRQRIRRLVWWKVVIIIVAPIISIYIIGVITYKTLFYKKPVLKPLKQKKSIVRLPVYNLGDFFIPISISSKEDNILKVDIKLELSNDAVRIELDNKIMQLRHTIYNLLKDKTLIELRSALSNGGLENEILYSINSFLQSGKVKKVSFQEFFAM